MNNIFAPENLILRLTFNLVLALTGFQTTRPVVKKSFPGLLITVVVLNVSLQGANQQQKDMIEQAASAISEDNTELACAFIQKTAVEKALPEMDKRLTTVR